MNISQEIVDSYLNWAKGEIFSSKFFVLFGAVFVLASIGFWQLGKSDVARAFIWPMLIAGILILTVGIGLIVSYNWKLEGFPKAYISDPLSAVQAEISYTEKTLNEYATVVFRAIPIIIALAALLIVFVNKPIWRAIGISTIAMLVIVLIIDGTASARTKAIKEHLETVERQLISDLNK